MSPNDFTFDGPYKGPGWGARIQGPRSGPRMESTKWGPLKIGPIVGSLVRAPKVYVLNAMETFNKK